MKTSGLKTFLLTLLISSTALTGCSFSGSSDDEDETGLDPDFENDEEVDEEDDENIEPVPVIGPLGPGASTLTGFEQSGDLDGTRDVAMFDNPVNVLTLADGTILVCDFNNNSVRRIEATGNVSTFIPPGHFIRPFGIIQVPDGTIYIQSDRSVNNTQSGSMWRVTLQNPIPQLVRDESGRVRGMAEMSDGRLVVVDYLRHHIRLFDPATNEFTPLAGAIDQPAFADGNGSNARFNTPYDVVVDDNDVIYVADLSNNRIRRIENGVVSTMAGDGVPQSVDGPSSSARFAEPKALALASDGTLYITDTLTGTIRNMNLATGSVTTIAGTGVRGFLDAENPLEAQFFGIEGIDLSPNEDFLYIADGNGGDNFDFHRVRRLTLE